MQAVRVSALNSVLGAFAGAVLAYPFSFFGAPAGAIYGAPMGLLVGSLAGAREWTSLSIGIACGSQLVGALVLGLGMTWVDPRSAPFDHAVAGMLGGGVVGIILAEILQQMASRSRRPIDGTPCSRCGYNLRGNVTGTCPECGTPCDPQRLDR